MTDGDEQLLAQDDIDRGINFGKTLVKMSEDRKAIEIFERILEFSENNPEAIEEIADFCMEYRMDEYIVKLLEPLLLELPKKINLLLTLAKSHENLNALNKAATYLNRALRLDENSIDIRLELAKIYMTINKPMLAEKPLKEILLIDPENEVARDMMNECA
jgi:tetratricopeptide (TPR) repeat protein